MRKLLVGTAVLFAATAAFADHFDPAKAKEEVTQIQETIHNFLSMYGHGDFDVSTLTVDQIAKIIAVEEEHPDLPEGKLAIEEILKGN